MEYFTEQTAAIWMEASPAFIRHEVRQARRVVNKLNWRAYTQARCSAFAALLRALRRCLGPAYVGREREPGRTWVILGKNNDGVVVPVVRTGMGAAQTVDDLKAPFELEILVPALFNAAALGKFTISTGASAGGDKK